MGKGGVFKMSNEWGEDIVSDLRLLITLGKDDLESIIDELIKMDLSVSPSELGEVIKGALSEENSKYSELIAEHLIGVHNFVNKNRVTPVELLDTCKEDIESEESEWTEDEIKNWQSLYPELLKLYSNENILISTKSMDLVFDHTNLFESSNIITDIRPVYNYAEDKILSAVVAHVLRIDYLVRNDKKKISFELDHNDLELLYEACERALNRSEVTKSFMEAKNIKTIISGE